MFVKKLQGFKEMLQHKLKEGPDEGSTQAGMVHAYNLKEYENKKMR